MLMIRPLFAMVNRLLGRSQALFGGLRQATDASVTLITAISIIPTLFGLGFCIDYARAEMLQSRIDAVADAAALTATDDLYIRQPWTTCSEPCSGNGAYDAAMQIFTTQVKDYADFTFNAATQLSITETTTGALNLGRTVRVGWIGQSLNMFSGILGMQTLSISGVSTASATEAPNMNFFLVMDKSPSMLLPTTSTGITETEGAASDGCAFACHQQFPGANYIKDVNGKTVFIDQNFYNTSGTGSGVYYLIDSSNNLYTSTGTAMGTVTNVSSATPMVVTYQYATGTTKSHGVTTTTYANATINGFYADGYWLTHNYTSVYPSGSPIDLRVNDETLAAQQLIPYAVSQEAVNSVEYQIQFFTYDWTHPSGTSPVTQWTTMNDVKNLSSSSVPNLDAQDWWISNNTYSSTSTNGDAATETNNMLTSMAGIMPAPGDGSSPTSPQEVMLIITDGVSDEIIGGSRTNREFNATDIAECNYITQTLHIKIAILYTLYDTAVISNDPSGWSQTNTEPYLPNVLPALQKCASTANDGSPLVYTVQSNQSIATALQSLFQLTIANSHLIG
jgi:hypothetical protein